MHKNYANMDGLIAGWGMDTKWGRLTRNLKFGHQRIMSNSECRRFGLYIGDNTVCTSTETASIACEVAMWTLWATWSKIIQKSYISIHAAKRATRALHFHTRSARIARLVSCIQPYFSLQMHAKLEMAHRLKTSKMRHNSTSINTWRYDVNIVTVCVVKPRYKSPLKPRRAWAFDALVQHFTPKGHYFAHWFGMRTFSLRVNGAKTRVLHACVKKRMF